MKKLILTLSGVTGMLISSTAFGDTLNGANTSWILTSTALVLLMTIPGLSLFYGGLVRVKNVLSVLMQCFAINCTISILWLVVGYSLAFSEGNAMVGGLSNLFMGNIAEETMSGDIPESVFSNVPVDLCHYYTSTGCRWICRANALFFHAALSVLWSMVVYSPITHWVWGGGWLGSMEWLVGVESAALSDFAGGTVVHITAGVAALTAAIVMGSRKGFPEITLPPHNMTMCITGACLLWVGWFGFNAGSALAANGDAGMAMLVTHMSASAGALTWMVCEWIKHGKPSALGAVTGMVARIGNNHTRIRFCRPGRWSGHWYHGRFCLL